MQMQLRDRSVIVTGGGLGIGAAYCQGLAERGARVLVADIDQEAAAAVAAGINESGGQAVAVGVDVTREDAVAVMAAAAMRSLGRIDGLVNNAAVYSALERKRFDAITPDEWDWVMAVNAKSAWLCARACFPYLKEQGGSIVNISSSTVFEGSMAFAHYVASKGAVIGLTRALAKQMGDFGIRVNCVAPGLTRTGRNTGVPAAVWSEHRLGRCLKRDQAPADLVGTVAWLLSDDSAFVTGQTILVDGGSRFI